MPRWYIHVNSIKGNAVTLELGTSYNVALVMESANHEVNHWGRKHCYAWNYPLLQDSQLLQCQRFRWIWYEGYGRFYFDLQLSSCIHWSKMTVTISHIFIIAKWLLIFKIICVAKSCSEIAYLKKTSNLHIERGLLIEVNGTSVLHIWMMAWYAFAIAVHMVTSWHGNAFRILHYPLCG